jgi:hypothetical protein
MTAEKRFDIKTGKNMFCVNLNFEKTVLHLWKHDISKYHVSSFISPVCLQFTFARHSPIYTARHWGTIWTLYQCTVPSLRFHRQTMKLISHTYHYVTAVSFSCFFTTNNVRAMELHLRCSISLAANLHIKLKLDLRWARQKRHRPHTW